MRIKGVLAPQETIKSAPIAQLDREHRSIANGQSFSGWRFHKFILPEGVVCSKRLLNQAVGKSLR
ncbi:MAG: hypothetical protein ACLTY9_09035, partial [Oscillospiraceae bacterium]